MTGGHDGTASTGPKVRPLAPSRDLGDRIVLFDAAAQSTVELLGSGVVVYRLIGAGRPEAEVLDDIEARYPGNHLAVTEARGLISDLVERGLLARDT